MENHKKVLIIDDDPDFAEATKIVLESKSYQVLLASDGEEGLHSVDENNPDLIILDVMMSHLDSGFDVSRQLKRDPRFKHIPIIILTAVAEKTGFDYKPEAGDEDWLPVDDYLHKPAAPSELLARVEKLLKGSSGAAS